MVQLGVVRVCSRCEKNHTAEHMLNFFSSLGQEAGSYGLAV